MRLDNLNENVAFVKIMVSLDPALIQALDVYKEKWEEENDNICRSGQPKGGI
jgi:hypothetical protein